MLSTIRKDYAFISLFRALAAFWVLAAHCMIWGSWYGLPLPSAKIAVDLFMMISGFLMAANADARWAVEPMDLPRSRVRFWLRRFFRLAPAYYLAMAITIAGGSFFLAGKVHLQALNPVHWEVGGEYDPAHIHYTLDNILMHISFLFGLVPQYASSMSMPDWSLGLEMQFYFAFPFLALAFRRFGSIRSAVMIGLPVYFAGASIYAVALDFPEPSLLLFKLQYFLAGMLLFLALECEQLAHRIWTIATALILVSLEWRYGQERFVSAALFLALFSLGLLEREGQTPRRVAAFINSRVVAYASDVSYSVYLFHGMFIAAFGALFYDIQMEKSTRTLLMFLFTAIGTYAVAGIIYRYVEMPGIELGRRTVRKLQPSIKHPAPQTSSAR